MTVGNLAAIAQRDFKRLMAFSSVAHAGYLLLGMLCLTPAGYAGAMFYVSAVLIMKYTCFMVMTRVADDGRNLQIDELAGLHRRAPLLALALMLAVFRGIVARDGQLLGAYLGELHQSHLDDIVTILSRLDDDEISKDEASAALDLL